MTISLRTVVLQVFLLYSLAFAAAAHAHFPWLAVPTFNPGETKKLPVFFIYDHIFPLGTFLRKERIAGLDMVSPGGQRTSLAMNDNGYFDTPNLESEGAYVLLGSQKPFYWTKTKNGSKSLSKEGLADVIQCSAFTNSMKSILNVGSGGGEYDTRYGQPLEIIPLKNPADLRVGDYMDIQVLLRGEPYRGLIFATYAGFATEREAYAFTVSADDQGKASIRIIERGPWLVKVKAEQHPYPDPRVCDVEAHFSTLTFGVR